MSNSSGSFRVRPCESFAVVAKRKGFSAFCEMGFTLLELLVTITLVAMVVLVLSMALKLTIGAWERGQREGDEKLIAASIPRLLERQLECIMPNAPARSRVKGARFAFCGKKDAISFFSCFAPMGSSLQGLLRMTYSYDSDKKTLILYEQPITRPQDLKEELDPLSDSWNGELKPVSEIRGVSIFELMYSGKEMFDLEDEDQWEEEWACNLPSPPKLIRLAIGTQGKEQSSPAIWYFHVGKQMRF